MSITIPIGTKIAKRVYVASTVFYDKDQTLICINNGDVMTFNDDEVEFALNAGKFSINDDNRDYMKDIATSTSGHILFLTSSGNIFTFGMNDKGQCGVDNDDEKIEQIDYDKDKYGDNRLTIPYQLNSNGILLNKFITNIWVGEIKIYIVGEIMQIM